MIPGSPAAELLGAGHGADLLVVGPQGSGGLGGLGVGIPDGSDLLFLVRANSILAPVTQTSTPRWKRGHHDPPQSRDST